MNSAKSYRTPFKLTVASDFFDLLSSIVVWKIPVDFISSISDKDNRREYCQKSLATAEWSAAALDPSSRTFANGETGLTSKSSRFTALAPLVEEGDISS